MIKNNNRKVPLKLALRSLKTGRMRNIFIVLTIALSAALIAGAAFSSIFAEEKERKSYESQQHVIYMKADEKQIEQLKKDDRITDVLVYKQGKTMEVDNYIISPSFFEQGAKEIQTIDIAEGKYPEKINEVLVDKSYMNQIGKDAKLGETLSFEFLDGSKEDFVISGFTDFENSSQVYSIYMSKAYAENGSQLKDMDYSAAVRIANASKMSGDEFSNEICAIASEYGIDRTDVNKNNKFATSLTLQRNDVIFVVVVGISILLISMIVIYSIFYISVTSRIRQFGQLRTIGCTAKQIKKMISFEGLFLCLIGAPIGILIGLIFASLVFKNGFVWDKVIVGAILILLVNLVAVLFSIHKPAKLASKVSPMEAAKSSGNTEKITAKTKGKKRELSPFGLAKISYGRNRKKSFMTSLSLAVGGILFIVGTTMLVSMNLEEYARGGEFRFGEYVIEFSSNAAELNDNGYTGVQMENPLNDGLMSQIMSVEGVKEVTEFKTSFIEFEYNNYRGQDTITSFNRSHSDIIEESINTSSFDYDKMIENKEILVIDNSVVKEIYGWKFKTGDKVKISWYNGSEIVEDEFTIAGDLNLNKFTKTDEGKKINLSSGWFIFPEEVLDSMMPESFNANSEFIVRASDYNKNGNEIEQQIAEIVENNPNLILSTLSSQIVISEKTYNFIYTMVFAFAAFIIGFSMINLINTLVSNVMVRKNEFAMLRSIGMSNKQLSKMIQYEGVMIAVKNIIITATAGNICGYLFIQFMRNTSADYMHWNMPWMYLLGYSVLIILAPIVISAVIIRMQNKKSLVERLREVE